MVSERGDERVAGRIRSEGRQLSAVPEEAVSTPLPETTSFGHGVGLLSHAGEDVLLSLLANQRGLYAQRMLLQGHGPGELGDRDKQCAGSGGVKERKSDPPYDTHHGGGESAGEAIGRLGGRREVGRGASSKSVMLVRHVSNLSLIHI